MPLIEALDQFPVQLNRCTIRFFDAAVIADINQLQKAAADPNVSRYMFDDAPSLKILCSAGKPPPTRFNDAASWIKDKTREAAAERIAACPPGQRIGLKGLIDGRHSLAALFCYDGDLGHRAIALSYWLTEDSWDRGYATECARWLVDLTPAKSLSPSV
ncbi:hypothetical protein DFJ73DRAFT_794784 [Zopfochytrium polystomum]|nr:hypothetical protein DFJ73DRAFT_794784 [Zopfochytrium polystomum]